MTSLVDMCTLPVMQAKLADIEKLKNDLGEIGYSMTVNARLRRNAARWNTDIKVIEVSPKITVDDARSVLTSLQRIAEQDNDTLNNC